MNLPLLNTFNNFEEINKQANGLSLTIGQATTIALDRARFKLRDLNKEFGITEKVVGGILFVADNLQDILKGLAVAFTVLITPKVFGVLTSALGLLLTIEGAVAAIGGAIIIAAATWETSGLRIQIVLTQLQKGVETLKLSVNDLVAGLVKDFNFLFGTGFDIGEVFDSKAATENIAALEKGLAKLNIELDKNRKNR